MIFFCLVFSSMVTNRRLFIKCPLDKSGQVWTSLDKFGQVWTSLDKSEQVWTCLDMSGQVWAPFVNKRRGCNKWKLFDKCSSIINSIDRNRIGIFLVLITIQVDIIRNGSIDKCVLALKWKRKNTLSFYVLLICTVCIWWYWFRKYFLYSIKYDSLRLILSLTVMSAVSQHYKYTY